METTNAEPQPMDVAEFFKTLSNGRSVDTEKIKISTLLGKILDKNGNELVKMSNDTGQRKMTLKKVVTNDDIQLELCITVKSVKE